MLTVTKYKIKFLEGICFGTWTVTLNKYYPVHPQIYLSGVYTGIPPGGLLFSHGEGEGSTVKTSQHPSGLEIIDFIDTGRDWAPVAPPPCVRLCIFNLSCPIKCECVELFCSICKVFTLRKDHTCPINKIKSIWQLSRQKYWNRRRQL